MPHCVARKNNGQPCDKHARNGDTFCGIHRRVEDRRLEAEVWRREMDVWFEVLDFLWAAHDRPIDRMDLMMIIGQARVAGRIDGDAAFRLAARVDPEWEFYAERYGRKVKPKSDLHALALDSQNVHTKAVATQTNAGMEMLLNMPIPETQTTMREIKEAWGDRKGAKRVREDMKGWYRVKMCREPDDRLYKRLLDGLWARIQLHEHRAELIERLWEECSEAVKMCCDGHISRLCSVLVGFDTDAKQEVSTGELLQQRIAAIAEKDIPVEHKVIEAWSVFEELKVPTVQREAWIDAF